MFDLIMRVFKKIDESDSRWSQKQESIREQKIK